VPAYKHDAAVLFAPGESHRLALVFFVPPGWGELTLLAGPSSLDLAPSFAHPTAITDLGGPPEAPELIEGKVSRVSDGRTIEVDVEGESVEVVYLGIAAPTGDACYAAQATAANSDLVLGKTVWLERERKNRTAQGAFARDAWLAAPDGSKILITGELVAHGAATPSPVEPDIRFAGVLSAAATEAQRSRIGFWSACGGPPPTAPG
jgi:endonuclease YncB( thermonuclease family)